MLKTYKKRPWTKQHDKKYIWLYNYMKEKDNTLNKDNYIKLNKRNIGSQIENNKDWSDGSKENLLFMIGRWLYNNGFKKDGEQYSNKGKQYSKKIADNTEENKLDEKEEQNFREHQYFIDLINNIDESKINNQSDDQKYLLLNLLVKQPPVRTSFYNTAKFITKLKDNDNKNNFIHIDRRGKTKATIIINKDKASNYKEYNLNKDLSKIKIIEDDLATLLYNSLTKYPPTYLFEYNNKSISENTLLKWLRSITKIDKVNINMMRSSYITHYYENNPSYRLKNKLSKQMRHSVNTASKNYNKVLNTENKPTSELLTNAKSEISKLQIQLYECSNNLIKNDNVITKKNKYDVLYNINVRKSKPSERIIKKYDLKYNEENKTYF